MASSMADGGIPDGRKAGMTGVLFEYGEELQAFESGPAGANQKLVMLGGLSDGLLARAYVPALGEALATIGWSLVQPVLSTSYEQWGFGSLDGDVEDLSSLLDFLARERGGETFALCGHSTGCQIACHFMRTRALAEQPHNVTHIVLQAGASDREMHDEEMQAERPANIARALEILAADPAGGGKVFMPHGTSWAPITVQRYLDLYNVGGSDDYFSSDLDDAELVGRFGGFYTETNVLVAYSQADEYVPPSVDKQRLIDRICAAMVGKPSHPPDATPVAVDEAMAGPQPRIVPFLIASGTHSLEPTSDAPEDNSAEGRFIAGVIAFLKGDEVGSSE